MAITMIIGIMPYSSSGVKVRQQGTSGRYHRAEGGGNSWGGGEIGGAAARSSLVERPFKAKRQESFLGSGDSFKVG
jgi:hypothetical protein